MDSSGIVSKLWGFCNKLRHDGVDSSDYIEQLTYLLFLKMADEKGMVVPEKYNWKELLAAARKKDVKDAVVLQLMDTMEHLKKEKGILGQIFAEPVSRVKNSSILGSLIEEMELTKWTSFDADVVGLAFEELIGRVANDGKKGAGQYFTPRPLIQTIVNVMELNPFGKNVQEFKICDVACGTAGFLVVAAEWMKQHCAKALEKKENKQRFETSTFYGRELVVRPRRLALMNLFLHGIDASETLTLGDSLYSDEVFEAEQYDCVLANPPFGNKGANQAPVNRGFPVKTNDKQLNFVQHIIHVLKTGGKAAIVLPDSCLTDDKAREIWAHYVGNGLINLHTILKLPRGIFAAYAGGVKACVVFLEKGKETQGTWIYDGRTNAEHFTKKTRPLTVEFFTPFEDAYKRSKREETERWHYFSLEQIQAKGYALNFKWMQDENLMDLDEISDPKELIELAVENLQDAIKELNEILVILNKGK